MNIGVNARVREPRALAMVCAAALILLGLQLALLGSRSQIFADFHAFYCGGAAVLHGSNPYAATTLASCESQPQPFGLHHTSDGITAPVPYPGYAFALFALFGALPYVSAAALWLLLLLACAAVSAVLLARLCSLPLWLTTAIVSSSYVIAVLGLGEVASIAFAGLCLSALALRQGKYWLASIALCVAAVLPHVLAPAFLAVFLFVPRSRVALAACSMGLIFLDVAISGPAAALEYFTRVLPAHAQSEIGYIAQYGITWMLHGAGIPDRWALLGGEMSYVVACVAGIACAVILSRRFNDRALLVALPPAFAVIAAPFMHYSEITLAFPALLLIFTYTNGSVRVGCATAIVLIAVPWQWIIGEAILALPLALAATFFIAFGLRGGLDAALRTALGVTLYAAALLFIALHFGPQMQHLRGPSVDATLVQASWTSYIRTHGASAGSVWWFAKLPTWAGLVALGACGTYAASNKKFVALPVVDGSPIGP